MSHTILVTCVDCAGTGIGAEGYTQCEYCLGQGHMAVNRAHDGGCPDGYREWRSSELGPVPYNPLTLRTDAAKA
jgi:DnaJ-class molecular chaperone